MRRPSLVLALTLAAACSSHKPQPLTPLPPDPDPERTPEAVKPEPTTPTPPVEPEASGPLDITVPAAKPIVKLVSAGKGKRTAIRLTPKQGAKQKVELAFDFTAKSSINGKPGDETIAPTITLVGDTEVTSVDKDGQAEWVFVVAGASAQSTSAKTPAAELAEIDQSLATIKGLTITGTVDPTGAMGDLKVHLDKPTEKSKKALDLVVLTMPRWPMLPSEPVGAGARWRVETPAKVVGQFEVTQTTEFELVARQGDGWTIKGATKVTGSDRDLNEQVKISKVGGTGSIDAIVNGGALYPAIKLDLVTDFTLTAAASKETMVLGITQRAAVTPK